MSEKESSKKGSRPQVVKSYQTFKLAEKWVNSMTKTTENESNRVVLEPRPARLGIGAAVARVSKAVPSNDPVERILRAKLNAEKRGVANTAHGLGKDERCDESSQEESESRTKTFVKIKPPSLPSPLQAKKKQK